MRIPSYHHKLLLFLTIYEPRSSCRESIILPCFFLSLVEKPASPSRDGSSPIATMMQIKKLPPPSQVLFASEYQHT
ncbi:hypothetical protein EYC84_000408 [Monilinia fructicola]|uniref:Uncharacterized protein n=1 Tax=Monilinia fructicola TaxID=38448 RepID=A0A5M9JRJ9_MONFR|nr:hypothetical protein EYC84_000408 [Monilinia fructicola]